MTEAITMLRGGVFWALCAIVALVSYRVLFLDMDVAMVVMVQHQVRPIALYGHIFLAPIALALVPLQFWGTLRGSRPGLHRWSGRVYAVCVLLSGLAGLWLSFTTQSGAGLAIGIGILAVLWLVTTAEAVRLAIARDFAGHRRWMIRSAALTFSAVTLRLQLPIGSAAFGFDTAYQIVGWSCWIPNLIVAEWLIRRKA